MPVFRKLVASLRGIGKVETRSLESAELAKVTLPFGLNRAVCYLRREARLDHSRTPCSLSNETPTTLLSATLYCMFIIVLLGVAVALVT